MISQRENSQNITMCRGGVTHVLRMAMMHPPLLKILRVVFMTPEMPSSSTSLNPLP